MRPWRLSAGAIGLITGLLGNMSEAQAISGDACEARWLETSGQFVNKEQPDYAGLLAFWQQQAGDCSGTGAYEARLAAIYIHLNDHDQAHAALAAARERPGQYASLIDLVELISDSFKIVEAGDATKEERVRFGERVIGFVRKYPDFPEGLAFAGGVQTTLGNHTIAIPLLERAFSLGDKRMSKTGLYRNAAISYAALGRYPESFDAAGAAVSERRGLTADPEFMYAVIKTQAELGMFKEAKTSVQILVTKMPAVKSDPEFQALIEHVKLKLARAKD